LAARGGTAAVPQRSRAPERRSTGPRKVRPQEAAPEKPKRHTGDGIRLRPEDLPSETARTPEPDAGRAAAAPPAPAPIEATRPSVIQARRQADPEIPELPPEALAAADPAPDAVEETPRAARTRDIAWVLSPKEANHLLRESRVGLGGAGQGSAPPTTAEPDETTVKRPPIAVPVVRKPAQDPATRPPHPARRRTDRPVPLGEEPYGAQASPDARPTPRPRRAIAPVAAVARAEAARRRGVRRWLLLVAALAVLAAGAWLAWPYLARITISPPPSAAPATAAAAQVATVSQGGQAAVTAPAAAETAAPATVPAQPAGPPPQRPAASPAASRATPPREPAPRGAAPAPVPTVGVVRGTVRDARSGAALVGARVTIPGTGFAAVTGADGAYALVDVPAGRITLAAALDGHVAASRDVVVERGAAAQVDITLAAPEPARSARSWHRWRAGPTTSSWPAGGR
jgi:hypothetical protein